MWHGQLPILTPCHPGEAVEVLETGRLMIYQKFSRKILRTREIFFTLFTRPEVEVQEWCRTHYFISYNFPLPLRCLRRTRVSQVDGQGFCGQYIPMFEEQRPHKCFPDIFFLREKQFANSRHYVIHQKSFRHVQPCPMCQIFGDVILYFYRNLRFRKLHGVIEIDESLFGRRVKFHRGNPSRGLKVN